MSVQIIGPCAGVETEWVDGRNGQPGFNSTTIGVEVGSGLHKRIEAVRAAKNFPPADLPHEGEHVALVVAISAYATRNGAGYRLTALERVPVPAEASLSL